MVDLAEFKSYVKTDKPVENTESVLGIEIERDNDRGIILLQMKKKIDELVVNNLINHSRIIRVENLVEFQCKQRGV